MPKDPNEEEDCEIVKASDGKMPKDPKEEEDCKSVEASDGKIAESNSDTENGKRVTKRTRGSSPPLKKAKSNAVKESDENGNKVSEEALLEWIKASNGVITFLLLFEPVNV